MTRVAILGGGPAGIAAAWRLREQQRADAVVIERGESFGGNAGSFAYDGHRLDYGSHRLHRATSPEVLADIRRFLGGDLIDRPRHGRIRLRGRWLRFPLRPIDVLRNLDKRVALGGVRDALVGLWPRGSTDDNFAAVLQASLGRTICAEFYFPYARKIWGCEPRDLSGVQARRRVSTSSLSALLRKVAAQAPGLKPRGGGRFYYPRGGFGQISEAYALHARAAGADLWLGWTVAAIERPGAAGQRWRVHAQRDDVRRVVEADAVWSTLPITTTARLLQPAPPAEVMAQGGRLRYRGMVLVYVALDVPRFSDYDAHYFPGEDVAITRLSEPKNYAARDQPATTVLCAEVPCDPGDARWQASDQQLGRLVARDLEVAEIPLPGHPHAVFTRRLPQAYPIYVRGYEAGLVPLDRWIEGVPGLLSYGRQGMFAHDNTHHALAMAYAACHCLRAGRFDGARWRQYREEFARHVVED